MFQGQTKPPHGQLHLCPILTRRIPTWLWLMPSCKWPVPMHTRSPCGTSSTVNAPSQHPGRFNPPYTYKHVPGCAYRRVVPASSLPSVARNRFCCGFLPGSSQSLSQGRTDLVQRTASTTAANFPPLPPLSCLGGFLIPLADQS